MKKILLFLWMLSGSMILFNCTPKQPAVDKVKALYGNNLDAFIRQVKELDNAVVARKPTTMLQQQFLTARKAYKQVEVFAEYYNPATAKAINGPALDEVEPDNPEYPEPPSGFQVIEELIYPGQDLTGYAVLSKEVKSLVAAATRLEMVNRSLQFTDAHIFDAVRLELFRMEALGLSGFDAPVALTTIAEIPSTLSALQAYLSVYRHGDNYKKTDSLFSAAIAYAETNNKFDTFNRAVFLVQFLNPLTRQLNQFQEACNIPYFNEPRPLAANAATLFDMDIFDPYFYTAAHKDPVNNNMILLGKQLFNEKRLSANNTRSCSSCHIEGKAFTDGLAKNNSFDGTKTIRRNTPTILYAALQPSLFADARLNYLEDQAKQVVENPDEMHGNLLHAAARLNMDTLYQQYFYNAYSTTTITADKIQQCIAAYIRTKNNFNSRFDIYMQGDTAAMNDSEIAGFNIFMGKAKCGTCHFMPLFNGSVPPAFIKIESEVLGVPGNNHAPFGIDTDSGRYHITRSAPFLHAFKTATVRNTAVTAPYMHNGVYQTLEEVLDFYNKGGGKGLGIVVDNQTLPEDTLGLNNKEKLQLIAFIHALTDKGIQ